MNLEDSEYRLGIYNASSITNTNRKIVMAVVSQLIKTN